MKSIISRIKPLNTETVYYFALLYFVAEKWGLYGACLFFTFDLLVSYINGFIQAYLKDKKVIVMSRINILSLMFKKREVTFSDQKTFLSKSVRVRFYKVARSKQNIYLTCTDKLIVLYSANESEAIYNFNELADFLAPHNK